MQFQIVIIIFFVFFIRNPVILNFTVKTVFCLGIQEKGRNFSICSVVRKIFLHISDISAIGLALKKLHKLLYEQITLLER